MSLIATVRASNLAGSRSLSDKPTNHVRRALFAAFGIALVVGVIGACLGPKGPDAPPFSAIDLESSAQALPPSLDGIALASSQSGAVRSASSPRAFGGQRGDSSPTLSDQVVRYRIEARLDPGAHTLDGHEQLTWRNRSDRSVQSVYIHLYLNAFESEGSTFFTEMRAPGAGFRSEVEVHDGDWGHVSLRSVQQANVPVPWHFVHPDGGPASDHTVVRLDLPAAVPAGATTKLDIDFFDQLPRVIARTGYFASFHMLGQWYPKLGVLELPGERGANEVRWNVHEFHLHSEFYADFGHFDVTLDVPEGYTVGATGEEVGPATRANGRVRHHFEQGDVHDFAWTADNRSAPPLTAAYESSDGHAVAVSVLYPPEYAPDAAPVLKSTLAALAYFEKTLGTYPYRTVTAVIPPYHAEEAGGMEYPTLFTTLHVTDPAPDTVGSYLLDMVTIHEFGHGYFYGILASNEFEEPMLDEGLNEYWDCRMLRDRKERLTLTTAFMRRLGLTFSSLSPFATERFSAELSEPSDALGQNAWTRASKQSYGSVYGRTALLMRDMEAQIGRDAMERSMRAYYETWKFRHPSTADLRDILAEQSGQAQQVDRIFEQHVYAAREIDDRVESLSSEEQFPPLGAALSAAERERKIASTREQWAHAHPGEHTSGPFPFRTIVTLRRRGAPVPQTLVVRFADGSNERVVWDDAARWKRFVWVKPVRAVWAELDPQLVHSLDKDRLDNSRSLTAHPLASLRVTADVGGLLQAAFALLAAL